MNDTQVVKYPLGFIEPIAEEVKAHLSPYCSRIEIAGSIRRRRAEIGDIELVLIPKTMTMPKSQGNMFSPGESDEVRIPGFINAVDTYKLKFNAKEKGIKLIGDPAKGKYCRRITPEKIQLDIFIANQDNWGYILVLRTGGATFNKWLVGPHGLKKHGYRPVGGVITRMSDNVVIPTPGECDVFRLMKMKYKRPEDRA